MLLGIFQTIFRERKFAEVKAFELIPPHPNILKFDQAWEERGHLFIQVETRADKRFSQVIFTNF